VAGEEGVPGALAYQAVLPGLPNPLPSLGKSAALAVFADPPTTWSPLGQLASPQYPYCAPAAVWNVKGAVT